MPLTFDMPLEQLKTYRGINPKPADFDEFWDKSIAEMHALGSQLELVPAEFQTPAAQCDDLYFTGTGGARIHAKLPRPRNSDGPHPAVVIFHGYACNSGDWFDKLPFVSLGFTVAALDCRGQGGKSQDPGGIIGNTLHGHIIRGLDDSPENLLFRNIFLDTAQLVRIVMSMDDVDAERVGITGPSQGGGLTLACAALEPDVKLAAPTFPFLCDYQRVWEMDLAKNAYAELQEYFRWFDPRHEREGEIFEKLGYIDVQHLAPRIRAEVQMSVGLMDQTCPPSTQFAAYNKITSKKTMLIYPDFGHEWPLPRNNDSVFQFLSKL